MGLFTTILATAAMAGTQIAGGIAASKEAKYNASLYEQKAGLISNQQGLEAYQYNRAIRQMSGTLTSRTAKSGFALKGSPMAVMIDNLTQMELDKSIGQYNLEVEKRYALAGAEAYKRQGKTALIQGYTNAFSTILKGGFDVGMSSGAFTSQSPTSTLQNRLQGRTSSFGGQTIRF